MGRPASYENRINNAFRSIRETRMRRKIKLRKKPNDHRRKYLANYQRNYTQVKVIIRNDDPEQVEILEWLRTHDDISGYIKSLIKADMKKTV